MPRPTDELSEKEWPEIAAGYVDEFGQIQLEVYMAAGAIWEKARRFAQSTIQDTHAGSRLLMRAAAIVSIKTSGSHTQIGELQAYLFQTYKNLVLDELRKENRRKRIQTDLRLELESLSLNLAEDVDRKILLEQIARHMDPWLRRVFEWRCLDIDFEQIARSLGEDTHVVRTRYSKKVSRLIKQINQETDRAENRARKRRDDCY